MLGQNFGVPDDIDEDELMGELDALEDDMATELDAGPGGVPSYMQVGAATTSVPAFLSLGWSGPQRWMQGQGRVSSSMQVALFALVGRWLPASGNLWLLGVTELDAESGRLPLYMPV